VLQCVAVRGTSAGVDAEDFAEFARDGQRAAVGCSVLQRVAVCGSAWQCDASSPNLTRRKCCSVLQRVAVRCSIRYFYRI